MNKEEIITNANKELIESGNMDVIAEMFATDYVAHNSGKDYKGYDFIRRWTKQLRTAIPDIRVVMVEFFIQKDDTIVWQRTLKGKHTTRMWKVEPSGRPVKWTEMIVSRFNGERIAEEWVVSELAGELLSKPVPTASTTIQHNKGGS